MTAINKSSTFVVISSIVFVASFFAIRAIFDKTGWSSLQALAISSLLSGAVAALSTPLLIAREKRIKGALFLGVYFLILSGVIALYGKENSKTQIKTGDVWVTKESDGENFIMDFFKKDSVRLVLPPNEETIVGYSLREGVFRLYDDGGNLLFDWEIEWEQGKFTIWEGNDKLVFYKQ
jgi:hypothetical protein